MNNYCVNGVHCNCKSKSKYKYICGATHPPKIGRFVFLLFAASRQQIARLELEHRRIDAVCGVCWLAEADFVSLLGFCGLLAFGS